MFFLFQNSLLVRPDTNNRDDSSHHAGKVTSLHLFLCFHFPQIILLFSRHFYFQFINIQTSAFCFCMLKGFSFYLGCDRIRDAKL